MNTPILFLDIENDDTLSTFLIGTMNRDGVYYPFLLRKGDDMTKFFSFLNGKKVVVFNANYDINHLIDISSDVVFINKEVICGAKNRDYHVRMTFKYKDTVFSFEYYDFFSMFPTKLEAVALLFGMKKGDFFAHGRITTEEFLKRFKELLVYNKNDIEIVRVAYCKCHEFFSLLGEKVLNKIFGKSVKYNFSHSLTISSVAYKLLLAYIFLYIILRYKGDCSLAQLNIHMQPTKKKDKYNVMVYVGSDEIVVIYKGYRYIVKKAFERFNEFFSGYKGGIVINEAVYLEGKDVVSFYDVNSLYPYAMTHLYANPFSLSQELTAEDVFNPDYYGIAHCVVHDCNLPLGLIIELENKNRNAIWRNKPIELYLSFPEIRLLVENGCRVEIKRAIGKRGIVPLKPYFQALYDLRLQYKQERSSFEGAVKLMMNSSYGKFGSRNETLVEKYAFSDNDDFVLFLQTYFSDEKVDTLLKEGILFDEQEGLRFSVAKKNEKMWLYVYKQPQEVEDFYFAATITSMARVIMQRYAQMIKDNKGVIYAVDTDSFKTNLTVDVMRQLGIVDSTKLGMLKHETTVDEFFSIRKKFYGFVENNNGKRETFLVAKGVSFFASQYIDDFVEEKELYHIIKEAFLQNQEYVDIIQERRPSFEQQRQTEVFNKRIKLIRDGGLLNLNEVSVVEAKSI